MGRSKPASETNDSRLGFEAAIRDAAEKLPGSRDAFL